MSAPRILGLAGSLRADSYNRRLVHVVCEAARRAGGHVTEVDLRDHPIPVFDEDLEARLGPDEHVRALKSHFARPTASSSEAPSTTPRSPPP